MVSHVLDWKLGMIWGMGFEIQAWNTLQTANPWLTRSWISYQGWLEAWDLKSRHDIHCRLQIHHWPHVGFKLEHDRGHGIGNPSMKYTADCWSMVDQALHLILRMIWGMGFEIQAWNILQTANSWLTMSGIYNWGWSEAWDLNSMHDIHCRLPICHWPAKGASKPLPRNPRNLCNNNNKKQNSSEFMKEPVPLGGGGARDRDIGSRDI